MSENGYSMGPLIFIFIFLHLKVGKLGFIATNLLMILYIIYQSGVTSALKLSELKRKKPHPQIRRWRQRWRSRRRQNADNVVPFRCRRLPGAAGGPGALPHRLPDEAAVGEQGSRGEPGAEIRQVRPGPHRFVQSAGAAGQSALRPRPTGGRAPGRVLIPIEGLVACWVRRRLLESPSGGRTDGRVYRPVFSRFEKICVLKRPVGIFFFFF